MQVTVRIAQEQIAHTGASSFQDLRSLAQNACLKVNRCTKRCPFCLLCVSKGGSELATRRGSDSEMATLLYTGNTRS